MGSPAEQHTSIAMRRTFGFAADREEATGRTWFVNTLSNGLAVIFWRKASNAERSHPCKVTLFAWCKHRSRIVTIMNVGRNLRVSVQIQGDIEVTWPSTADPCLPIPLPHT